MEDVTNRKLIFKIIKKAETITAALLASKIGISEKGIWYHLAKLKKAGEIKHIGPTKGGNWVVLKG
ncbi:MAG: hypothetical protein DRJ05_11240 [Bacteroidetes bacterium]|nr:MAG: hypothetical protein DRJ05_11240 [Bacteroidota bacterium]